MIGSNPNVQHFFRKQTVSQRRPNPGFSDTVSSANKQKMVKETSRNLLTILQGRRLMGSVDEQAKTQLIDFLKSRTSGSASGPNLITLHSRFFTFEKGLITLSKVLTDPQKKQLSDILFGPDQTKNFFHLAQSTFDPIKENLSSYSINQDDPIPVLRQAKGGRQGCFPESAYRSHGKAQEAIFLTDRLINISQTQCLSNGKTLGGDVAMDTTVLLTAEMSILPQAQNRSSGNYQSPVFLKQTEGDGSGHQAYFPESAYRSHGEYTGSTVSLTAIPQAQYFSSESYPSSML